jgi:hypothetical protein
MGSCWVRQELPIRPYKVSGWLLLVCPLLQWYNDIAFIATGCEV